MIKGVEGDYLINQCDNCSEEIVHNLSGKVMKLDVHTQTYENLHVHCTCGAIAVINMNLPLGSTEEPPPGGTTLQEDMNRYYARILIETIREDFVSST